MVEPAALSPLPDLASDTTGAPFAGTYQNIDDLPGPKGLPLLGNMLQLDPKKIHLILESWATRYGSIYVFRMGSEPIVAVSSPKLAEQMLRDRPEGFSRSHKLARIFAELGVDGVFSTDGEAWRQQRRLAVHALASRNLRKQYEHLTTIAGRLKTRWNGLADAGAPIDITDEFKRFTVDATTLIAFGYDINTIEQDGDVIQRKLELLFPTLNRRLFALFPLWRIARLPRDRRVDRALLDLRVWLGELVAAARLRLARDPALADKPSNFLEAMLAARDDKGRPFSEEVLFANLITMLVAGEDTTAYTLAWAVHQLCDSPQHGDALRREADATLADADFPRDVEAANTLAWAAAVADETMRMRPVAPLMFTNALQDKVLGSLRVPRGTKLVLLARPAAMDPAHFEQALSFKPERWLGQTTGPHDGRVSIPFGSGPRICPGRALALLEMKLLLAMLYKNFDVERVGAAVDVREELSFTMIPVGLKVRLHRRASPAVTAFPSAGPLRPAAVASSGPA